MRGADAVIDRFQEQPLRARVAGEREFPEVEQRMIEIPAVDSVGIFVVSDIGQIAAQRLQLWIIKASHAREQLGLERMRPALPYAPVVPHRDDRTLVRQTGVKGQRVAVRVDLGCALLIKKQSIRENTAENSK